MPTSRLFPVLFLLAAATLQAAPALTPGAPIPAFAGNARDYAATSRGDYAKKSFAAEATVIVKSGHGGNGCAFLGLGDGKPNPAAYGEPTSAPSLVFRLAPNDFADGSAMASVDGSLTGDEAPCGDGTHRVRFLWDAGKKRAMFQIHRNWKNGDTFAPTTSLSVPDVGAAFGDTARFFVGGASGVVFSDFSSRPLAPDDFKNFLPADIFPKDASAHTWLPVAGVSDIATTDAATEEFLKNFRARVRPLVCWYKGAELLASRAVPAGGLALNSKWKSTVSLAPVEGEPDARDLTLTVSLKEGVANSAGIAAAFDFDGWSADNYVLVPASIYGGNRNRIEHRGYCTGFDKADFYDKNMTQATTDLPQLSPEPGKPSKFEVSACNASTPAVCVYDRRAKRGFILLAEQGGRGANGDFLRKPDGEILDNMFGVEESPDRTKATLVVGAPGVRSRKPAFIGFSGSPDRGVTLKAGDAVTIRLRLYSFDAKDMPAFFEKFMAVRKALTGPNHPRDILPMSEWRRRLDGLIDARWYDNGKVGFYRSDNNYYLCLGWVGGLISTYPPLALGDEMHRKRVLDTFDLVIPAAQGASGHYYPSIGADKVPTGFVWYRKLITLTRQDADVLFWTIKHFELLKAQGHAADIRPEWEASMKKLAEAFVTTFDKYGQWGNYINHETGEPAIYGSTSGAIAVGGLALAADWFREPAFMDAAKKAGKYYYDRDFVGKGFTYGACSDTMQNADSETAIGFAIGLTTLYEKTGDKEWLERARAVTDLAASWVVSYDYELPKTTRLGATGAKLAGIVWASTQNKHGAPGFCTNSADPFFKVYRATGDARYAATIRDVIHAHTESIAAGNATERLTYCDAEARGEVPGGYTPWIATDGALMAIEIPGIYLRTDIDRVFVFDSVKADVVSRDASGVKLRITNPTKFDASVALFAEDATGAQKPLGETAFLKWPKVAVKTGETVTVAIAPDGGIVRIQK